jgi:hypothetical protein
MLPHVPAAGLAWLRAVAWAWRRRLLGQSEQHELWVDRPDGVHVRGVVHLVRGSRAALLAVGGSTGGLHGPAWIYPELCARLQSAGITGLRLDYHRPNRLEDCTQDVLAGIHFLEREGARSIMLLGWSFGGAVVIRAGVRSPRVVAVATVGAQTAGTGTVGRLAPRSLLVLHGTADPHPAGPLRTRPVRAGRRTEGAGAVRRRWARARAPPDERAEQTGGVERGRPAGRWVTPRSTHSPHAAASGIRINSAQAHAHDE